MINVRKIFQKSLVEILDLRKDANDILDISEPWSDSWCTTAAYILVFVAYLDNWKEKNQN